MKAVYFNEYNIRMGPLSYLPIVSGLLRAHAETSAAIKAAYKFKPFIYAIDNVPTVMANYDAPPAVAGFSLSLWNEQLNLVIARIVKRRWPECLIVFGGPQVPHHPTEYMLEHDFIDVCVRAEGEEAFTEILERFLDSRDFGGIASATYRTPDGIVDNPGERPFQRDLDVYPSPYLEGLFDYLVEDTKAANFQAIIETNRGCPFHCTFCYWGKGGLSRKYRYQSLERVYGELEWAAKHKIKYVFNADSNFGMNKRDSEIADYLVALKGRTGYPDKFRTCYGKNTDDKIFKIGSLFHKHRLEKGITLARQSNDATVLKNIKRGNISMETYKNLQERFNGENIPIYSELILGLPGETEESWRRGIDELLRAGLKNQLFIYFAQVFPNTDLHDPAYQKEFGIETRRIALNEIHGTIRDETWVVEYEDIVIRTNAMSTEAWRRMAVLSWMTMLMHSLKLGFFVMAWLYDRFGIPHVDFLDYLASGPGSGPIAREVGLFHVKLDEMLAGKGRGCVVEDCGPTYWDVEEASFIRCVQDGSAFYGDLYDVLSVFILDRGHTWDDLELADVLIYQANRIPQCDARGPQLLTFQHNLPAYFDNLFTPHPVALVRQPSRMGTRPIAYAGDLERFARESILWGRKSGTLLTEVSYDRAVAA